MLLKLYILLQSTMRNTYPVNVLANGNNATTILVTMECIYLLDYTECRNVQMQS